MNVFCVEFRKCATDRPKAYRIADQKSRVKLGKFYYEFPGFPHFSAAYSVVYKCSSACNLSGTEAAVTEICRLPPEGQYLSAE
jgi:hypothetical protein